MLSFTPNNADASLVAGGAVSVEAPPVVENSTSGRLENVQAIVSKSMLQSLKAILPCGITELLSQGHLITAGTPSNLTMVIYL